MTAAEALRGQGRAKPSRSAERSEGELWVHEVIGSEVRDRAGTESGGCVAVEANPAHDLLVLDGGALVPMVFVVVAEPAWSSVDPPEGLFDL